MIAAAVAYCRWSLKGRLQRRIEAIAFDGGCIRGGILRMTISMKLATVLGLSIGFTQLVGWSSNNLDLDIEFQNGLEKVPKKGLPFPSAFSPISCLNLILRYHLISVESTPGKHKNSLPPQNPF